MPSGAEPPIRTSRVRKHKLCNSFPVTGVYAIAAGQVQPCSSAWNPCGSRSQRSYEISHAQRLGSKDPSPYQRTGAYICNKVPRHAGTMLWYRYATQLWETESCTISCDKINGAAKSWKCPTNISALLRTGLPGSPSYSTTGIADPLINLVQLSRSLGHHRRSLYTKGASN